jgi:hypothetical protein
MKQSIIQAAWLVQIGCLLVMAVYVASRPGFRALLKQVWKATGFRWSVWVFAAATLVVLGERLLRTLGIG